MIPNIARMFFLLLTAAIAQVGYCQTNSDEKVSASFHNYLDAIESGKSVSVFFSKTFVDDYLDSLIRAEEDAILHNVRATKIIFLFGSEIKKVLRKNLICENSTKCDLEVEYLDPSDVKRSVTLYYEIELPLLDPVINKIQFNYH